jgi:leader peptidase (prepilin peptidase)/N-methyltransferase
LAVVDWLERRLPNPLTALAAGSAVALLGGSAVFGSPVGMLQRALVSCAIAGGFYLAVAVVSGGGLGAGDVKVGALIGLEVGSISVRVAIIAILIGLTIAGAAGAVVAVVRRSRNATLPLGPALIAGALLALGTFGS